MEYKYLLKLLRYVLPITDLLMLNFIYFLAYYVSKYLGKTVSEELSQHYVVVCNLIWLFSALLFGLYTEYGARRLERIYRETWRSVLLHLSLFSIYLLFEKDGGFSRTFILIFYSLLIFFFILNRFIGTAFQMLLIKFYGFIGGHSPIYNEAGALSDALIAEMKVAASNGVEQLYVSVAPERMAKVHRVVKEADKQCLRLKFIPDIARALAAPYLPCAMSLWSRLIFSSLVIIFILSWLYPIIALLIKMQGKGPVLFKQPY